MSTRDDPGPERGRVDCRLAAHMELPAAHVAPFVDFLEGEESGIVIGWRWPLHRRERVGWRPGGFRYHHPHYPQADDYHQALQRDHEPHDPDHHLAPSRSLILSTAASSPSRVLSAIRFYALRPPRGVVRRRPGHARRREGCGPDGLLDRLAGDEGGVWLQRPPGVGHLS